MAVVVSQAAGCIITSGEEDAVITANWSLRTLGSNQIIPCPPGTTTASIYAQPVDEVTLAPFGAPYIDLFDCDDNFGRSRGLQPDMYQVWVQLESEGGGNVFARSLSQFIDVIDVDKSFTTEIFEDAGYFQFDWTLVDSVTNVPFNCSADPAIANILAASMASATNFVDTRFPCAAGTGVTKPMTAGPYTVEFDAEDSAMRSLSPAPTVVNGTIRDKNQVTDLGSITIRVD